MRVALYARYSTDLQSAASIEDQLRLCRAHAAKHGWTIVDSYSDRAISGSSLLRPGIQSLIEDSRRGKFEVVLAEALDRLSRDQSDVAGLYKRLTFCNVKIHTLSEGHVGPLHIGLTGTMNALQLVALAEKTRRGLQGRVELGKSAGGLCYGYSVPRRLGPDGMPVTGERTIVKTEAAVIRRVLENYAEGQSARAIAVQLNKESIPGPRGAEWGSSTLYGNVERGTGLLNNALYVGKLVWNRQRFIKDPETGKRVARLNDTSEWVVHDVPEWRIVPDELWDRVKARQAVLCMGGAEAVGAAIAERRRPRHLFSGLVRCGVCGSGYSMISKDLLGCSRRRNNGTCSNALNIRRDALEASVLSGLRDNMLQPAMFKEFCEAYTKETNRLRMDAGASQETTRTELARVERQIRSMIGAIKDGLYHASMKQEMDRLETRRLELQRALAEATVPPPLLHPSLAEVYRQRITGLTAGLMTVESTGDIAETLRLLVTAIILNPEAGELTITLQGDLAEMLAMAQGRQRTSGSGSDSPAGVGRDGSQLALVAGTRNHRQLTPIRVSC